MLLQYGISVNWNSAKCTDMEIFMHIICFTGTVIIIQQLESFISLKLVVISSALVVMTSGVFEEEQRVSLDFRSLIVLLKYFQIQKQRSICWCILTLECTVFFLSLNVAFNPYCRTEYIYQEHRLMSQRSSGKEADASCIFWMKAFWSLK